MDNIAPREKPIWSGRPAIGVYLGVYLLFALIFMGTLVVLELYFGTSAGSTLLPKSITIGGVSIPYPVEILTGIVILLVYFSSMIHLILLRARNKYELYVDGLTIDRGIINLENIYVAPMAFSDARLIRNWLMRLAGRGLIIVDTNDDRHFHLQLIKNPVEVKSFIRKALGHPTFRTETEARELSNNAAPKEDRSGKTTKQ
jgi:hypothetical protein